MDLTTEDIATCVIALLSPKKLFLTDEKVLQEEIEKCLKEGLNQSIQREVSLTKKDIIDFIIEGLGIEVKIKGSKTAIYHQLGRYAESDRIKAILLITNKACKMPPFINGKDIYLMSLGNGWL